MEFHSPTRLEEALDLLAMPDARLLAGGQSLVAMMNLELIAPARVISLRRIAELRGLQQFADGAVRIGSLTTHAELASLNPPAAGPRLLVQAARVIGYPAVRNFGTIGGAVAHADPAADYPAALLAADAHIELASRSGRRRVDAGVFFRGMFETAALPGEIVVAIHVPPGPPNAGAHYEKFSLVAGDFAIATVAAIVQETAGRCLTARIAIGACGPRPLRLAAPEAQLEQCMLDDLTIHAAGCALAEACPALDDQRASGAYRRRIIPELVRRAIRGAMAQPLAGAAA